MTACDDFIPGMTPFDPLPSSHQELNERKEGSANEFFFYSVGRQGSDNIFMVKMTERRSGGLTLCQGDSFLLIHPPPSFLRVPRSDQKAATTN